MQKKSKKQNSDILGQFLPNLARDFKARFEIEVESAYCLISGRMITTRKDGKNFTKQQHGWVSGYSDAYERVSRMLTSL